MGALKDDLTAAKALIDTPEKWGKGKYEPSHECYCALGAIAKVAGHDPAESWLEGDISFAYTALGRALPKKFRFVPDFNDHPDTTHADIMALFDRAIEAAD